MPKFFIFFFLLGASLISPSIALSDWNTGVTIEEVSTRVAINISDGAIEVKFDLSNEAFSYFELSNNSQQREQDLFVNQSLSNIFEFLSEDDNQSSKLALKTNFSTRLDPSKKTLQYKIYYSLNTTPEYLTIKPNFDALKRFSNSYSIAISHFGLPVIDHATISSTEKLKLDWADPWNTHFLNPDLKRDHNDPIMGFLYIQPKQLKNEVIIRVKEAVDILGIPLKNKKFIAPGEFELIKQRISQFLLDNPQLLVDDKAISPTLERIEFIKMGATDIQSYTPTKKQLQTATLLGISFKSDLNALPTKIDWNWKLFSPETQQVSIRAYDASGLFDSYVTPEHSWFNWDNFFSNELLDSGANQSTLIRLASPITIQTTNKQSLYLLFFFGLIGLFSVFFFFIFNRLSWKKAIIYFSFAFLSIFQLNKNLNFISNGFISNSINPVDLSDNTKQLLLNIYLAFNNTNETSIYDTLSYSLVETEIEKLYLQSRQKLEFNSGAHSKITDLNIISINKITVGEETNLYQCTWEVIGDVIHWGHQHKRKNVYEAQIRLVNQNGFLKIKHLKPLSQQRV